MLVEVSKWWKKKMLVGVLTMLSTFARGTLASDATSGRCPLRKEEADLR
jgi:hypothetical protein